MNLKQSRRKDGRIYLSIEKAYRDKATGKPRARTIRSLGYLDVLQQEYPDPVAHFKEAARRMTEEEHRERKASFVVDLEEKLPSGADSRKNLGYAAILKIYHELGLDEFFRNKARSEGLPYNTSAIMTLLVISGILSPGSKRKAFEEKDRYFERFDFSLADLYDSFPHFARISKEVQKHLHEGISSLCGRDTDTVYYDVTNFRFESDRPSEPSQSGAGKEVRPGSVIQMGLATDMEQIPLHFDLFPANASTKEALRTVIGDIRKKYGARRVLAVGDMDTVTGDTLLSFQGKDRTKSFNGYVIRIPVRSGPEDLRKFVLSGEGYVDEAGRPAGANEEFKVKSRRITREITATLPGGNRLTKTVIEKQVVFLERRSTRGQYQPDCALSMEEQLYEGYSAMVTSELDLPDTEVIGICRNLRELEESCRVAKRALEAQPALTSLQSFVQAHFLTCFTCLTMVRILKKRTGGRFSAEEITDCLNRISCTGEYENTYLFDHRSPVSDALGKALGLDFTRKRLRLADIKAMLAQAKK